MVETPRSRRRSYASLVIALAVIVAAAIVVPVALAHIVGGTTYTTYYNTSLGCAQGYSNIGHSTSGTGAQSTTYVRQRTASSCGSYTASTNHLRIQSTTLKNSAVCNSRGWVYNPIPAVGLGYIYNSNCGSGSYTHSATVGVFISAVWRQKSYSNSHGF